MMEDIKGYSANLGQFLNDATEWGGIVLFDGLSRLLAQVESRRR